MPRCVFDKFVGQRDEERITPTIYYFLPPSLPPSLPPPLLALSKVISSNIQKVLSQRAYMLFYIQVAIAMFSI